MIKLQHLAVIFAIIIIPISLVLGYYVRSEIDTLKLQATYDEALIGATFDAVKAYQINTAKNAYSLLERSQRRDIEASISTFISSFATGLGVGGYGENNVKTYIPAMVFTLYDGFYIYAPTENNGKDPVVYEHVLKPYITYSQRYVKRDALDRIDVNITYTLDNYITINGTVNDEYVNKAGYLINIDDCTDNGNGTYTLNGIQLGKEELKETLLLYSEELGANSPRELHTYKYYDGAKYYYDEDGDAAGHHWFIYQNGKKYYTNMTEEQNPSETYDYSTYDYITEAVEFTQWVQSNLGRLTIGNLVIDDDVKERNINDIHFANQTGELYRFFSAFNNNDYEDELSLFSIHKNDMIRLTIKENLSSAIAAYNTHAGTKSFMLPTLRETEWDQLTKNINVVAFVQGMPVGFKTYNNYAIISNTRNETYMSQDELAFIDLTVDQSNPYASTYHRIDCPYLTEGSIKGYRQIDFEQSAVQVNESTGRNLKYYYRHANYPCYYCIVARNYTKQILSGAKQQALKQTLYREKQLLHY